ncbi:NUDIX domain-containing protein [Gordonia sinesedis]
MASTAPRRSSGILLYRHTDVGIEVLIAHPGGPLWARKDDGAWSIPKGLYGPDEPALDAARREFAEEIGSAPPDGEYVELGDVRLASGKVVTAFAIAGDLDPDTVVSNTFDMVWPPKSGRVQSFPEVDRAGWFGPDDAKVKLNPAQAEFIDRLVEHLATRR